MSRLMHRDPFARFELHREVLRGLTPAGLDPVCSWCGGRGARRQVYRYFCEHDGLRTRRAYYAGAWCSARCFRDAHDVGFPV